MHREHRAKLLELALREGLRARAVVGVVLPVRLRHAEIQVAVADAVDVVYRAAGGMGALDVVLAGIAVHQAANRTADLIVDAGLAAGADGDESLLRLRDRRAACQQGSHREAECRRFYVDQFPRSSTPNLNAVNG